jgi:hypothetical protein
VHNNCVFFYYFLCKWCLETAAETADSESPDVYVKNSQIPGAGLGLFAKRDLSAGELREPLRGELTSEKTVNKLFQRGVKFSNLMSAGAGMVWDCANTESFAKYANTLTKSNILEFPSLHINSIFQDIQEKEDFAYLVNLTNIRKDDEIFVDYGNRFKFP